MKVRKSRLVIQAKLQIGTTEIAPAELNKVKNILKKSSCRGEDFSLKINKENLNSEQVTELTSLQNENKMLKDQLDTQSKHENKMQSMKRQFEDNSQMSNDQLSRAHETIKNQALEIANYVSQVEELEQTISNLRNSIFNLKPISNSISFEEDISWLQSKILKLQDPNTPISGEVKHLMKS